MYECVRMHLTTYPNMTRTALLATRVNGRVILTTEDMRFVRQQNSWFVYNGTVLSFICDLKRFF